MKIDNMKFIVVFGFVICASLCKGQSREVILNEAIVSQTIYEQDVEGGDNKPLIVKKETYDKKGLLIDLKQYDDEGKNAKDWFVYKYNEKDQLVEEIEYNSRAKQKKRTEYKYNTKGLKSERLIYDEKNRLSKKRIYEYTFK